MTIDFFFIVMKFIKGFVISLGVRCHLNFIISQLFFYIAKFGKLLFINCSL